MVRAVFHFPLTAMTTIQHRLNLSGEYIVQTQGFAITAGEHHAHLRIAESTAMLF